MMWKFTQLAMQYVRIIGAILHSFQLTDLLHPTEAVLRWASFELCVKQGSPLIWWVALLSAPWWGLCLPRREATAEWESEHANGPSWEQQSIRFCMQDCFELSNLFKHTVSHVLSRSLGQCLRRSWTWHIQWPPCLPGRPLTPASVHCLRTNKLRCERFSSRLRFVFDSSIEYAKYQLFLWALRFIVWRKCTFCSFFRQQYYIFNIIFKLKVSLTNITYRIS